MAEASQRDLRWMDLALEQAQLAFERGEVPIGAVLVKDDELLAAAYNLRETQHDPTAHAEIVALRRAAQKLQSWRLVSTQLYVTCEPCPMCAGALVNARVSRVIYGCDDPKAGACSSLYRICDDPRLNHRLQVVGGVRAEQAAALLKKFFESRRAIV
ncbi:MAG: tRNA adenosine(34) deaminase TadA [Candidatus Alcyoniella australis]|nr:tRNA adenosine(34) deaminase TadA [Candidatus Alcyoniella australis]